MSTMNCDLTLMLFILWHWFIRNVCYWNFLISPILKHFFFKKWAKLCPIFVSSFFNFALVWMPNQMFKSLMDSTISPRLWSCSELQNPEKRICCVEQHGFHLFFADFPNICQDIFTWTVLFYCQRFHANHTHFIKVSRW